LRHQYAAVGAAATLALPDAVAALSAARERVAEVAELEASHRARADMVSQYVDAYRGYCWTVNGIEDLRLAPFHLLASEGRVHTDRDHPWHMQVLARLSGAAAGVLMATQHLVTDVTDPAATAETVAWWSDLTAGGGEGMVVKPLSFIARGPRGVVQPAVKCRGREYLRIIYGPEYTAPDNLERLRARRLGSKRALALREFSLGLEALQRFVAGEPLRRVHECVFGVLALESEPVDPRL
jgi:protein phosphatase